MVLPQAKSKKVLKASEKGGGEHGGFKALINQGVTETRHSSSEGFSFLGRPLFSRTSRGATVLIHALTVSCS